MARESKRRRNDRRFGRAERLADMALSLPWAQPAWTLFAYESDSWKASCRSCREAIADVPAIVADNVAEYLYANSTKEEWNLLEDFPPCPPPFREFFIEYARPSCINSEGKIKSASSIPRRCGWLVESHTVEDVDAHWVGGGLQASIADLRARLEAIAPRLDRAAMKRARSDPAFAAGRFHAVADLGPHERTALCLLQQYATLTRAANSSASEQLPDGTHWIVRMTAIFLGDTDYVLGPLMSMCFSLGGQGQILEKPAFLPIGDDPDRMAFVMGSFPLDDLAQTFQASSYSAILALSFLNCKNVALDAHEPDRQLNRERHRAGLKPFLRYHTINIEPMKAVLKNEGGIEENGLSRALHICRGHFATYTDDKPLFGRLTGTYWRPAHTRGSLKQGVVVSDYKVNSPRMKP